MGVHNDEVGSKLAEAMMLLEMATDMHSAQDLPYPLHDMITAAHSLVQSARGAYVGHPVKVERHALTMLACINEASATNRFRIEPRR